MMTVTRRGTGATASMAAFASQVHPVFMLPPLATSLFGAILAGSLDPVRGALHLGVVFFALYTAHVTDGYVDFYERSEDDDHPLTRRGCQVARLGATVGFLVCLLGLWFVVDWMAVVLAVPGWVIAVLHAPQLDVTPVGATLGYPTGVSLSLLGGYYVQAGELGPTPFALAIVFLVVLAGIKVVDDAQDYEYDSSIGKRTVAVVLGPQSAFRVAYGLMGLGMGLVLSLVVLLPAVPPGAALAPVAFGGVALVARRVGPELATMLLVRGSYVFLAVLVASMWFRPLA